MMACGVQADQLPGLVGQQGGAVCAETNRNCCYVQAKEAQEKHGLNRLTPPKEKPEIIKFLLQFTNPLMALLLIAGGLTFMAYTLQTPRDKNNAILAAALIIVVTLTCIMSYFQERSASNVMGGSCRWLSSCSWVLKLAFKLQLLARIACY